MQQRIVRLVRFDLLAAEIGGGHVGAGMAIKAHGAQMQEDGFAAVAGKGGGLGRGAIGVVKVQSVGLEVDQTGTLRKARLDPTGRRLRRDADAIVLADEQQGQGRLLVGRPLRGIECALCG